MCTSENPAANLGPRRIVATPRPQSANDASGGQPDNHCTAASRISYTEILSVADCDSPSYCEAQQPFSGPRQRPIPPIRHHCSRQPMAHTSTYPQPTSLRNTPPNILASALYVLPVSYVHSVIHCNHPPAGAHHKMRCIQYLNGIRFGSG